MDLPDLKQLGAIIDLCRKKGVSSIQIAGIRLELKDEAPSKRKYSKRKSNDEAPLEPIDPQNPFAGFPDGELTPEQLMFYSAGGLPENDPFKERT